MTDHQARDYFRRDQSDGVSPPDLSKDCTFAEHIVHARGKRTQLTSVSLDLSKIRDFGDTDYRLERQRVAVDGHTLIEHDALLEDLRKVVREGEKAERLRATQALRYARRRKEGLLNGRSMRRESQGRTSWCGPGIRSRSTLLESAMDELFSCRNCIHNCGQSLMIGPGVGYCLQHDSAIPEPNRTTCKYLHRKDLPHFVVDEGTREHAAEFAGFARLVALDTKQSIEQIRYSEKYQWEHGTFDPVVHAVAQYYKIEPRWGLISAFAGGVDGRRSLTHCSLVRHYMDRCGTWTSSYRLVLGLVREIDVQPQFEPGALCVTDQTSFDEALEEALWDVVFARLSAVQEYGWHAGLEPLMWASDSLNGALADMSWPRVQTEFARYRDSWVTMIISEAKKHGIYFPAPEENPAVKYEGD